MKKYVLISSILSISMISNCMEKETSKNNIEELVIISPDKRTKLVTGLGLKPYFVVIMHNEKKFTKETQNLCTKNSPLHQLNTKTQARISLEPEMAFSLNDETIQELQTILTQRNKIKSDKTVLINIFSYTRTQEVIDEIIKTEHEYIDLNKKLNVHLAPEKELQAIDLSITELAQLYRKIEARQKFAEDQLLKNESDELFILMQKQCKKTINNIIGTINNLVTEIENLETLSQAQKISDK